jgi:hypothetical protein
MAMLVSVMAGAQVVLVQMDLRALRLAEQAPQVLF